jgi:hypothetical protein
MYPDTQNNLLWTYPVLTLITLTYLTFYFWFFVLQKISETSSIHIFQNPVLKKPTTFLVLKRYVWYRTDCVSSHIRESKDKRFFFFLKKKEINVRVLGFKV